MTVALPPPLRIGRYRIGVVCLGNICRSPTAEVVIRMRLDETHDESGAPLSARVAVDSVGTGDWHIGEPMDERAARTLARAGYDPSAHRARQVSDAWLGEHDLILTMDSQNLARIQRLATPGQAARTMPFRIFDPILGANPTARDLEVPDPWSGGQRSFDEVLTIIERTATTLTTALATALTTRPPE